ncbi:MAG: ferredoxin reductase [Alcanivoracaceae bacterium]|nr:ferredoxin reductase [Alcanivoracaceae bacterium]
MISALRPLTRIGHWLATPVLPESYLELINPLLGAGLRGRIERLVRESDRAVSLEIRPNHQWQGARPGQYVRLGIDVDGVRHWRCYSVSSAKAGRNDTFTVTVNAIDGGQVSTWLNWHAQVGMVVMLDQAAGDFVLPQGELPKLLFVTAGSGITPVMGMLRSMAANGQAADVVHLHYSPDDAHNLFAEERRGLSLAHGWKTLNQLTRSRGDQHFSSAQLDALCPDWAERLAYACGPTALMDATAAHWQQAGLAEQLKQENFRPALKAVAAGAGGEVRFWNSERVAEGAGDKPLLEVAEQAGLMPKHGCRMGICQGCLVTLKEGQVRDLTSGEVFGESGDMVRICVCAAAGNVTLEL